MACLCQKAPKPLNASIPYALILNQSDEKCPAIKSRLRRRGKARWFLQKIASKSQKVLTETLRFLAAALLVGAFDCLERNGHTCGGLHVLSAQPLPRDRTGAV